MLLVGHTLINNGGSAPLGEIEYPLRLGLVVGEAS
jgi:hypothetical protein